MNRFQLAGLLFIGGISACIYTLNAFIAFNF